MDDRTLRLKSVLPVTAMRPTISAFRCWRVGRRDCTSGTGSPGAVTCPRFPQNVACGFPAPRSSAVGSQYCELLQLPIWEAQFWRQQRCPFFDLVVRLPVKAAACPTATTQHPSPVTFYDPIDFSEAPEIPGNTVIAIVASQDGVDFVGLVTDFMMPYSPHQLL